MCVVGFGCYILNTVIGAFVISCLHIFFFFFKYMEDLSFVHICYHHIFNQRSYAECNIRTTFRSTSVNHPGMEKGPCITLTVLMALLTWNSCIHIQRILKERLLRNIFLMHNYNILLGYQNLKC